MSKPELIRSLFDYNEYANDYVIRESAELTEDELRKGRGASWGSIEANLIHITDAQLSWVERWRDGRWTSPLLEDQEAHGIAEIKQAFSRSHDELQRFVGATSNAQLDKELEYEAWRGGTHRMLLWQLMIQLMNHGTHHRAEICMALTAMGRAVKELDYHFFEQERGGPS